MSQCTRALDAVLKLIKLCSIPEEELLDENREAAKYKFYNTGMVDTSSDGTRLCYSVDVLSREQYTVHAIDLSTRSHLISVPIEDCSGQVIWALDNKTLFFVKQDDKLRPFQASLARLCCRFILPKCSCTPS